MQSDSGAARDITVFIRGGMHGMNGDFVLVLCSKHRNYGTCLNKGIMLFLVLPKTSLAWNRLFHKTRIKVFFYFILAPFNNIIFIELMDVIICPLTANG